MDTVELVMTWEEEFGITIGNDEAAKIETVGAAVDLIHEKLSRNLSTSAEKAVISGISGITGIPGETIRKESRLDDLFPGRNRDPLWSELQERLGFSVIGELHRPRWLVVTGWILALAAGASLFPLIEGWAFLAMPIAGFFWIAATQPLKRCFPPGLRRAGDLVSRIEKQQAIFRQKQLLSREALREAVVQITVNQLGVKPEQCTDDAKFVADLGCD